MPTVLISGVFDPLHAGHLAYIERARMLGEVLCVVSDSDKHPPLVPLDHRAALLAALTHGDVYQECSVTEAIVRYEPDAFLKGYEWDGRLPQEIVDACALVGTEIMYCAGTRLESSSALLAHYERARNAEKLAAFERFVQGQKPADTPWEPVTDYSRETRRAIEAPQADILAEVFKGCSVLDYGCGFGYLVELLQERGMDAHGWDPQQRDAVHRFPAPYEYDLVICREVLEHLTVGGVWRAVNTLKSRTTRYIYVTTRFCAGAHLLDVDGSDDLDPTHITMLNQDLLRTLFVLEGCTRRADLEAKLDHRNLGRVLVYEVPRD